MRERGTLLADVCSHCAVSLREERLLHSRPSIYAERREKGRNGEGRDKRCGGTDRNTDVDRHQPVSKCFPLGLHTSCDAVTLNIVPSDSFVLRILIPFLPLSLIVAVTLRVGPAISVTITPRTFTDDYRTGVRQMIS